jgi:hypothetical protein
LHSVRFVREKGTGSFRGSVHRGGNGVHATGRGGNRWRQQTAFEHFSA